MSETIVYKGRRYDVSRWAPAHPGGQVMGRFLGQDVTCAMNMVHDMESPRIRRLMAGLDAGPAEDHPVSDFDRDYLELQERFRARGWFRVDPLYYLYKVSWVLAYLALAFWLGSPVLKGVFLGLFIQQAAFIAHDVCHDSVVPRRWRWLASWLFCDLAFGVNHEHWVEDHNEHHLIVNRPQADPQINNMPQLVYSQEELELWERTRGPLTLAQRVMLATQHLWFVPVLLVYGRPNILRGSIQKGWRNGERAYLVAVAIHLLLWIVLAAQCAGSPGGVLAFLLSGLVVSGLLHIQLLLSHIYAPRLGEEEQRRLGMRIQAISNQNITTTFLDDWLHGGLQHHIEHHLFPRLPRHRLAGARPEVRDLCERHGLPYRSEPFLTCLRDLLAHLRDVSAPVRRGLLAELVGR